MKTDMKKHIKKDFSEICKSHSFFRNSHLCLVSVMFEVARRQRTCRQFWSRSGRDVWGCWSSCGAFDLLL